MRVALLLALVCCALVAQAFKQTRLSWAASRSGTRSLHLPLHSLAVSARAPQQTKNGFSRSASDVTGGAAFDRLPPVGETVIGQVEDSDQQSISFVVKGDRGGQIKASMPSAHLSWQERMTLQVGAMMQLYVSRHDLTQNQLVVALRPPTGAAATATGTATVTSTTSLPQRWSPKEPKMVVAAKSAAAAATSSPRKSGVTTSSSKPNLLINNLKTGMKLTGTVSSCTPFAAFVSVGVQRAAKGGQYRPVQGMLHKSDIPKDSRARRGSGSDSQLLEKGASVTVYVKEVYKNSGRFTVTLDPAIEKAQVIQQKIQVREEGKERRRSRRLRRVLETVTVGDTLTGVVDRVVPEGVLVTVTSLGPLNVTGLLRKKDLPKQFELPPDLRESFQAQLLSQDFIKGREVTCGVMQVNTNANAPQEGEYSMRLLFERLGAVPEDDFAIIDKLDSKKSVKGAAALLEDQEDEDLPVVESSDLKEIYTELRGNKPLMLVQDLYDWADIQDMLEEGEIDEALIEKACQEVGIPKTKGRDAEVRFLQFQEIVEIIQDGMDGIDTKAYDDDDDELDIEEAEVADALPVKTSPITMAKASPPSKSAGKVSVASDDDDGETDSADESGEDSEQSMEDLEDEAIEEVAQEIYDELRGKSKTLSAKAFREWSDIQDLQSNNLISEEDIAEVLSEVGAKKDLSFEQFFEAVQVLEDIAAENGMEFEDEEGGESKGAEEDEDEDGDVFEIDEAAEEEMLEKYFEQLKGKSGKVTMAAFKKWDEIVESEVPQEELDAAFKSAGVSKAGMDFPQFLAVVRALDEAEEIEDEDGEEGGEVIDGDGDEELEIDFDDEDMTPEENEEMLKMLFDTLRGKKSAVSLKTFLAWDDVQDMLKEGVLDQEAIDIFLAEVGHKKGTDLNYEQFAAMVTMLDENMRAMGEGAASDEMGGDGKNDDGEEEDDEDVEIDEAELEEVAREIYDELRGKAKALPVKAFKQWDEVKSAVAAGILTQQTLDVLVKEVQSGSNELSFEDFKQLVRLLDEAADVAMGAAEDSSKSSGKGKSAASVSRTLDDDDEDDEVFDQEDEPTEEELEEFAREIFDELKSAKTNKVTVKAFKAWEGVQEVIESGELSAADLKEVLEEVDGDNKGSLNFDQFRRAMDLIEEKLDDSAFDEDDDEEDEEEEAPAKAGGKGFARDDSTSQKSVKKSPPSAAAAKASGNNNDDEALAVATEIFDELRGKKKTLSVKTFKEWEDTADLIESGALKRSTLEKAIVKVGAYESGEMSLKQFVELVDIIQANIDESALSLEDDDEDEDPSTIPTSKQGKVMKVRPSEADSEDADIDWENEGDAEELTEEEEARLVFDELRGTRKVLPLVDFLKWEDVQELLACGALSRDNLATAIENAGLTVEKGDLTFEAFSDLIQIIDEFVDKDKLPGDDEEFDEDDEAEGAEEDGEELMDLSLGDGEDEDEDEGDYEDDAEVEEMFKDIAKGKAFITEKALYKWDELQELIESGLASKETIEGYLRKLDLQDGKIDLDAFKQFIAMLDTVLIDGEGNLLEPGDEANAWDGK